MAFSPHFLVQYGGPVGTAGEIWSNNIRMASNADGDTPPDPEVALTKLVLAIRGLLTRPNSRIGGHASCTYVKWNKIGPDGKYVSGTASHTRFLEGTTGANAVILGGAGSSDGNIMPFNVAIAVTWLTDFARGRGSKGRIYSPAPRITMGTEGQIDSVVCTNMASSYATFIKDLKAVNTLPGDSLRPVVASGINGALNPITKVSVGSVPDTMRSRRNALVESRSSVVVPA